MRPAPSAKYAFSHSRARSPTGSIAPVASDTRTHACAESVAASMSRRATAPRRRKAAAWWSCSRCGWSRLSSARSRSPKSRRRRRTGTSSCARAVREGRPRARTRCPPGGSTPRRPRGAELAAAVEVRQLERVEAPLCWATHSGCSPTMCQKTSSGTPSSGTGISTSSRRRSTRPVELAVAGPLAAEQRAQALEQVRRERVRSDFVGGFADESQGAFKVSGAQALHGTRAYGTAARRTIRRTANGQAGLPPRSLDPTAPPPRIASSPTQEGRTCAFPTALQPSRCACWRCSSRPPPQRPADRHVPGR